MNAELVGIWSVSRAGAHSFEYAESWLKSARVRALSISIPIPIGTREIKGPAVKNYFDNLLPDNRNTRERISRRYGTKSIEPFDLLGAIGRDCVGAVQILPVGEHPESFGKIKSKPLNEKLVEEILVQAAGASSQGELSSGDEDFRISIAGAQEKTALLKIGSKWHIPVGSTPTTHILKLPLGLVGNVRAEMYDSVENEWLCLRILKAMGLPVADCTMETFGNQNALVVERFDRKWTADRRWIHRLPQEDFCQATGTPSNQKYEVDGGPGIWHCLGILAGGSNPDIDRLHFVLTHLSFWLLAAIDGHGKNFSIFLESGGGYRLTPIYDVLSAWPIIGRGARKLQLEKARLAMAIRGKNAHSKLNQIQTRHWRLLAAESGVVGAFEKMMALVGTIDEALSFVEKKLPKNFPEPLWKSVKKGVLDQKKTFEIGLKSEK